MPLLTGLGVSPGLARGRALIIRSRRRQVFYPVPADRIGLELQRLADAQARSRAQIEDIGARLATLAGPGPASLFEAQLLMLDDPLLLGRARTLVEQERYNAEWALQSAADELIGMLGEVHDPYLRERHGDVRDVVGRLILNLRGRARGMVLPESPEPWLIVADDLPPSTAAQVDWRRAAGFVTEVGSWTSHTAILARSLGVASVVGVPRAAAKIRPGTEVLLDGESGDVLVDPDEAARDGWLRRPQRAGLADAWTVPSGPTRTADGVDVRVEANLDLADEVEDAIRAGATGIGLFRSEFLLGTDGQAPSEEAQTAVYRQLLERTPGELTVRTFDPAGDRGERRRLPGMRGLTVDARLLEQFTAQIRALLRAAPAGRLRILLPFIIGAQEVRTARTLIAEVAAGLRAEGLVVPAVPVGAMVEVPSAALTADRLVEEADFLSVGTNDLIALTLAVDREDQTASRFYDPLHPAVLRLLRLVARAGSRAGRRVAVCGEMAADPRGLVLLAGLGFREFSMTPSALARARQLLAHLGVDEMRQLARDVRRQADGAVARLDERIQQVLDTRVPTGTGRA